jgi:hypothetical protein
MAQMPVWIETVSGLDEADRGNGHKVIQFHLRAPPLKALRKKLYLRHKLSCWWTSGCDATSEEVRASRSLRTS